VRFESGGLQTVVPVSLLNMNRRLAQQIDRMSEIMPTLKELAALEPRVERAARNLQRCDADTLYRIATYSTKAAAAGMGVKYQTRAIHCYTLAMKRASEVAKDRIIVDLAGFLDISRAPRKVQRARRMLREVIERADIGIAAYGAIALAMSYEDNHKYKEALGALDRVIADYGALVKALRKQRKWTLSEQKWHPVQKSMLKK
jgi:hypothetical protein